MSLPRGVNKIIEEYCVFKLPYEVELKKSTREIYGYICFEGKSDMSRCFLGFNSHVINHDKINNVWEVIIIDMSADDTSKSTRRFYDKMFNDEKLYGIKMQDWNSPNSIG